MRRLPVLLVLGVIGFIWAGSASASVLWQGTFQSDSFANWTGVQEVNPDRLQIIADPLGSGQRVLQAEVYQGDNPIGASGNRNELFYKGDEPSENTERFYRWQTMWPQSYVSPPTWQLFTQFHHTSSDGSPPVEFYANGENINLRIDQTDVLWTAPLERGVWHDFVLHVNWSSDKTVGFVELYYDGKLVLSKTYGQTMFPGESVFLKQGLYRNADITQEQTVYQSGAIIATTLDDVMPPTPSGGKAAPAGLSADAPAAPAAPGHGGGCDAVGFGVAWPSLLAAAGLLWQRRRRRLS